MNSKASILLDLKGRVSRFLIPDLIVHNGFNMDSDICELSKDITRVFKDTMLIFRSSAADEDGCKNSLAGEYASVLNISSNNPEEIIRAINLVIASYEKKRPLMADDEVIIQEMVKNTTMSGVIFTYDLNTGAPYYVINYDDQSGLTDTVTSGGGGIRKPYPLHPPQLNQ